jgi:hypothetical protein
MCLVCVELIKHRMTLVEAEPALKELTLTRSGNEHHVELLKAIEELDLAKIGELLEEGKEG